MITIYRLNDDSLNFDPIGRIQNGEITSGKDLMERLIPAYLLDNEDALLDLYDGPKYVAAYKPDPANEIAEAAAKALSKRKRRPQSRITKGEWVPYEGPRGGEGWQHSATGEVVYQEEKPENDRTQQSVEGFSGQPGPVTAADKIEEVAEAYGYPGTEAEVTRISGHDWADFTLDFHLEDGYPIGSTALFNDGTGTFEGWTLRFPSLTDTEPRDLKSYLVDEGVVDEKYSRDMVKFTSGGGMLGDNVPHIEQGATIQPNEFLETLKQTLRAVSSYYREYESSDVGKTVWKADGWIPYEGPRGGEGWQHSATGEVVYQDEMPGQRSTTEAEARPPDGAAGESAEGFTDLQTGDEILFEGAFFNDDDVLEGEIRERIEPDDARPNGAYVVDVTSDETSSFADEQVIFPNQIAEVVGGPSEDAARESASGPDTNPDYTDFDELREGQEIVFRDTSYYGEGELGIGEISRVWTDRDNITVITEDGTEKPVYPKDFVRLSDAPDRSPPRDPTAGDVIHYRDNNGEVQQAEVMNVRDDGDLWVDVMGRKLTKPLDPDRVIAHEGKEDYREDQMGDFERPDTHIDGPATVTNEWMEETAFPGMDMYVYDKFEGEVRDAYLESTSGPRGELRFYDGDPGESHTLDENTKRFDVVSAQSWEKSAPWERTSAMMSHVKHGISTSELPDSTYDTFKDQVRNTILPSFKDHDTMREVVTSFKMLRDKVSRASCGNYAGGYQIKLSRNTPADTTNHEFGHGIMNTFDYDYVRVRDTDWSSAQYDNRPWNMAHEHQNKRDENGLFRFDFSEGSDYLPPEKYMFQTPEKRPVELDPDDVDLGGLDDRHTLVYEIDGEQREYDIPHGKAQHTGRGTSINYETDYDTDPPVYKRLRVDEDGSITDKRYEDHGDGWEVVEEESGSLTAVHTEEKHALQGEAIIESVDQELAGIEHTDLEDREYDTDWTNDEVAKAFAGLEPGDAVMLNVARRDFGSDEITYEVAHLIMKERHGNPHEGEKTGYVFEKPNGGEWSWSVNNETGELVSSNGSTVIGVDYSRSEEVDTDLAVPEQRDIKNPSHPLAEWAGFNTEADTLEEKVENLAVACNRSWYKHAATLEQYANGGASMFDTFQVQIGGNYSASNAHETIAMTHELMQTNDEDTASGLMYAVKDHPWLVHAYTELFEPSETAREQLQKWAGIEDKEFDL